MWHLFNICNISLEKSLITRFHQCCGICTPVIIASFPSSVCMTFLIEIIVKPILLVIKNITVLTPENKKRTADIYTRTVLLSQSCLNNCWIVWRSLLISRGFVINAVKPADSLSFLASSVTHAVVAMIGTDRESLLRELLGNWVTRASELRRDTAFFQGASMTPLLFAL